MKLRSYQVEAIDALWNALFQKDSALLVAATGMGKTETIFGFVKKALEAKPDIRILFAVNKVSLVDQTFKRAKGIIKDVGVYCGSLNSKENKSFTIASVQSLSKKETLPHYDLIIFDEAHRINLNIGSQYQKIIKKSKDNNQNLKIIGMTATPFRNDGYIYGDKKLFDKPDYVKDLGWAIENNWLVKPSLKHVDKQFDTTKLHTRMGDFDSKEVKDLTTKKDIVAAQVDDAMIRVAQRKKVIWHCSCIEHAELVHSILESSSKDNKRVSSIVHSKMDKKQREEEINIFENNEVKHLVFVMIVSEGYDHPEIDTVVLMRPTKSPLVYIQCIGRALRLAKNKTDCLVLDYAQVVKNCGPLNNPHIVTTRGAKSKPIDMKFCPECFEYLAKDIAICSSCGYDFIAAKLKEQKKYMEGLTSRPDTNSQLLEAKPKTREPEWIDIEPSRTQVSVHNSAAGNKCLKFTFYKKNSIITKYNKFVIVESNTKYLIKNKEATLYRIMNNLILCNRAEECIDKIKSIGFDHLKSIRVDLRGKYPDVVGFKYE